MKTVNGYFTIKVATYCIKHTQRRTIDHLKSSDPEKISQRAEYELMVERSRDQIEMKVCKEIYKCCE